MRKPTILPANGEQRQSLVVPTGMTGMTQVQQDRVGLRERWLPPFHINKVPDCVKLFSQFTTNTKYIRMMILIVTIV